MIVLKLENPPDIIISSEVWSKLALAGKLKQSVKMGLIEIRALSQKITKTRKQHFNCVITVWIKASGGFFFRAVIIARPSMHFNSGTYSESKYKGNLHYGNNNTQNASGQ